MRRAMALLLGVVALLTASCGLKIDMPTLGSVDRGDSVASVARETAR